MKYLVEFKKRSDRHVLETIEDKSDIDLKIGSLATYVVNSEYDVSEFTNRIKKYTSDVKIVILTS